MVTGDVPFRAESALGVITKHLTEEPTPPSKRRASGVPEAVEAVILRGLKKNKEERYATASEMRAALFEAVGMKRSSSQQQQRATGSVPADAWAATGVSTPASTPAQAATRPAASSHPSVHGELAAQPGGGRNTGLLVASLAIAAALAGGAWVMFGKKGDAAAVLPPPAVAAPKLETPKLEAPPPTPPAPKEPAVQPVAAPIPPAPEPAPPTVLAAAAPAHTHKKHESHAAAPGAPRPVAAAPAVAAPPPPPEAAKPAAPKGAFAEGEALLKTGDVDGALAKFQDAARANPSDAKAQKMIGKCYNRLGQHDRAVPYLKRYLELAPDAADKAFIQAQIDQK
jgi:serine/threonine-protein kinase